MDENHDCGGRPGQPHWRDEPKPGQAAINPKAEGGPMQEVGIKGELAPVKRQYDDALHLMEVQGGSFVQSLAACCYCADSSNKATLRSAFAHYFDSYEDRFQQHRASLAGTQGDGA